jgi:hypothetical protein
VTTPLQWKMWKSVACQHVSRCRNIMSYKLPTSCKSPAMLQRWGSRAVPPTAMGNLCFSTTDDRHTELCYGFFGNIAQVATAQLIAIRTRWTRKAARYGMSLRVPSERQVLQAGSFSRFSLTLHSAPQHRSPGRWWPEPGVMMRPELLPVPNPCFR